MHSKALLVLDFVGDFQRSLLATVQDCVPLRVARASALLKYLQCETGERHGKLSWRYVIYISICTHIYVHGHMYIYTCIYIHIHIYLYTYVYWRSLLIFPLVFQ